MKWFLLVLYTASQQSHPTPLAVYDGAGNCEAAAKTIMAPWKGGCVPIQTPDSVPGVQRYEKERE